MQEDVEIIEPEEWLFLYEEPNNGWWLKIDNYNDLIAYHQHHADLYGCAIEDYVRHGNEYDKTGDGRVFDKKITQAVVKYAEWKHLSIMDAAVQFRMMVVSQQLEAIHKNGYIVLNKQGGYHSGLIKYSQFFRRKKLLWPDFKESDIRITQFPDGTHWYVHIGEFELRENENIKWNTYKEAMDAAMRYVRESG